MTSAKKYCDRNCQARARYGRISGQERARVRKWEERNRDQHRLRQGERTRRRREAIEGTVSTRDWNRVLWRANGRCHYCGKACEKLTVDHVLPLSRGGMHTIGNLAPACPSCNYQKHNKTVMEWRVWKIRREHHARTHA